MTHASRFYLDHAATSWPKPPGSLEACIEFQTHNGAAAGRGIYQSSEASSGLVRATRESIAELIHAPSIDDIALCSNGTQALNATILGLLQSPSMRGCHVVTTATEHNSVLRPLALAAKNFGIRWTVVACDATGMVDPNEVDAAIGPQTKMLIVNHASNVTGAVQKISAMKDIARLHQVTFVLDAAQTLGYLPIDVVADGIDALASPGHKGAGGMLGTGLLYLAKPLQTQFEPVWIGGTGTHSDSIDGPFHWQAAIESGNSNLPGIASLNAGIRWLLGQPQNFALHTWTNQILEAIQQQSVLQLVGPSISSGIPRLPVVSLINENASCHEMAMLLDSVCNIEARSGFHCAGLIHPYLGTQASGGTLRLSLGHTTTQADVDAALQGLEVLNSAFG